MVKREILFIDVALDDLWEIAKSKDPNSDEFKKLHYCVKAFSAAFKMPFYADDIDEYANRA